MPYNIATTYDIYRSNKNLVVQPMLKSHLSYYFWMCYLFFYIIFDNIEDTLIYLITFVLSNRVKQLPPFAQFWLVFLFFISFDEKYPLILNNSYSIGLKQ